MMRMRVARRLCVFPLLDGFRRITEDFEPRERVGERRAMVHVARDARRKDGLDQARQELRDLAEPIEITPRDGQLAKVDTCLRRRPW